MRRVASREGTIGGGIVFHRTSPSARMRVVCFPYAGGAAHVFRPLADSMPPGIELAAFEPPGRGTRVRERPITHIDQLRRTAANVLEPYLSVPFVLFGWSMGAVLAFEVARELRSRGARLPERLLVGAAPAPQLERRRSADGPPDDIELMKHLRDHEGTPPAVLTHAELLSALLPVLRADFQASASYSYTVAPPLACPIAAIGGTLDRTVSRSELEAWVTQTTAGFSLTLVEGGHLLLRWSPELVVGFVVSEASQAFEAS